MVSKDALAQFEILLAREREYLVAGRFTELQHILESRDELLRQLTTEDMDPVTLDRIRDGARRNARLAEAAAAGIREATQRLEAIRKASGPIGSYGADGSSEQIGPARPHFERKA